MKMQKMQKIIKHQPNGRYKYDWEPIRDYGIENPGETFTPLDDDGNPKVYPQSLVGGLIRGRNRMLHTDEWTFTTRNNHYSPLDGRRYCNIYFTYNGEKEE